MEHAVATDRRTGALFVLDRVADVTADLGKKRVAIRFDAARVSERQLENALRA